VAIEWRASTKMGRGINGMRVKNPDEDTDGGSLRKLTDQGDREREARMCKKAKYLRNCSARHPMDGWAALPCIRLDHTSCCEGVVPSDKWVLLDSMVLYLLPLA
jgi:hypothetical protein